MKVKEALQQILLENMSMDEIIEIYGMEVAQEVGEILGMIHEAITKPEDEWKEAHRLYELFLKTLSAQNEARSNSFEGWLERNYTLIPR